MQRFEQFYINGQWVDPVERRTLEVINPATEQVVGVAPNASVDQAQAACAAAKEAFDGWSRTPVEERCAILDRIVPLDRIQNASGVRRPIHPAPAAATPSHPDGIAPLLRRLMADYAATGLPPAYLPEEDS